MLLKAFCLQGAEAECAKRKQLMFACLLAKTKRGLPSAVGWDFVEGREGWEGRAGTSGLVVQQLLGAAHSGLTAGASIKGSGASAEARSRALAVNYWKLRFYLRAKLECLIFAAGHLWI